ncbi:MAG: ABC transporter permease [Spirochaetaceae bacterium]|jgi:peptide/nickel transport system permease protein|nr:ABC transporter permease [Spirochaetaceae bacterium]
MNIPRKIGAVLCAVFVLAALVSIVWTPHSPFVMDAAVRFASPSPGHPFGTDNFGRDVLSRAMVAVRYSLLFSAATVALSAFMGVAIGLAAAFVRHVAGLAVMRLVDAVNSIPVILLTLVLVNAADGSALGKTGVPLVLAMTVVFTPAFIRITRNEAVKIKSMGYIDHARVLGAGKIRIMYAHILPNLVPSLGSTGIIVAVQSVMVESALSYLGFGIQPPLPSLGKMLFDAQGFLFRAPWMAIFPAAMVALLLCGLNYLKKH